MPKSPCSYVVAVRAFGGLPDYDFGAYACATMGTTLRDGT